MVDVRIRAGDWIVVCDGAKALILENVGDATFPNLKTREVHTQPDPMTHDQGTDAPGRTMNSADSRRSAVQATDWHALSEQRFLEDLADRLDAAVTAGDAKSLILVAPPRALGVLRQAASKHLRAAIRAEVEKDYVKLPVHEIEKHLAA